MKTVFYSGLTAGAMALAVAYPAFADISAQQVRDELFGYYESFGYEIEVGSEAMNDGVLEIKELTLKIDIPEEDSQFVMTIDALTLSDTGDGAVIVELPQKSIYSIKVMEDGEEQVSANIELELDDYAGLVSGDEDKMTFESGAAGLVARLVGLTVEGENIPATVSITAGAFASDVMIETLEDDFRGFATGYDLESLALVVNANDPDGDGAFSLTANFSDLLSDVAGELKSTQDPKELLEAGFWVAAELEGGAADFDLSFKEHGEQTAISASADGGHFAFEVSPEGVAYEISEQGVAMSIASSELPIPAVKLAYDDSTISFSVPLAKAAEPSDFHFLAALRGLTISEAIWAMFDPGQSLPRDPATVAVDVSGKVMVLQDLMNPETLATIEQMDSPPMLPVSLDLNELTVSAGGAALTGKGAVEMDMQNPVMVGGIPLPSGEIDLRLEGSNGLVTKLVGLGLIPAEGAAMVMGMLGAFSRPVGDDQLETKIAISKENGITANGLPLPLPVQ